MARRTYTEEKMSQAVSMVRSGMSVKRTAAALEVSRDTVKRWNEGSLPASADKDRVEGLSRDAEESIANRLEVMIPEMLDEARKQILTSKFKDLLIGSGIGIEKLQLLRGRPTARSLEIRVAYIGLDALPDRARALISGTDTAQLPVIDVVPVVTEDKDSSV